ADAVGDVGHGRLLPVLIMQPFGCLYDAQPNGCLSTLVGPSARGPSQAPRSESYGPCGTVTTRHPAVRPAPGSGLPQSTPYVSPWPVARSVAERRDGHRSQADDEVDHDVRRLLVGSRRVPSLLALAGGRLTYCHGWG